MKNEGGFALVITLIITALLVALSAEFIDEVYVDTSASHNFVAAQQASIHATSGVDVGVRLVQLSMAQHGDFTSLLDPWAGPLSQEDAQGKLVVSIEDESGKLNLNAIAGPNGAFDNFYYPALVRLLKRLNLSPDLCDAIADWIDNNEDPHPGGGETSYYRTLKPPYDAKNARLESVEELALVKGFSPKVLEQLRPFVTVYQEVPNAPTSPVNINTAPREVIASLDEKMTDDLAARVLDYRKTTPFRYPADMAKVPGMESIAQGLSLNTTARGSVFRIRSQAFVRDTSRIVEAVVRIGPTSSAVLYWREY